MNCAIKMTTFVGLAAILATGCGGSPSSGAPASGQVDFTSKFSAEGLTLEASAPDRVAGVFVRDGVQIAFEFRRDAVNRYARFASASGQPFLESTLTSGVDSSVLLGGKARAQGSVNGGAPTLEGEPDAFAELSASPEARLLPELKEALIASHVDSAFLGVDAPEARSGQLSVQSWYDGTYWHLGSGERVSFWSWSWWGWTTVVIASEANPSSGYAAAFFQVILAGRGPEYVGGYGMQSYRRQWWGAQVTVGNDQIPLCAIGGSGCPNVTMLMRHY
jgi:hypothetical protein